MVNRDDQLDDCLEAFLFLEPLGRPRFLGCVSSARIFLCWPVLVKCDEADEVEAAPYKAPPAYYCYYYYYYYWSTLPPPVAGMKIFDVAAGQRRLPPTVLLFY